jgi:hypothetical protein
MYQAKNANDNVDKIFNNTKGASLSSVANSGNPTNNPCNAPGI